VFKVVAGMLQFPFLVSFQPLLAMGLVFITEPKITPLYQRRYAYIPILKLGVCYPTLQELQINLF
jgi:hypothetical protein